MTADTLQRESSRERDRVGMSGSPYVRAPAFNSHREVSYTITSPNVQNVETYSAKAKQVRKCTLAALTEPSFLTANSARSSVDHAPCGVCTSPEFVLLIAWTSRT